MQKPKILFDFEGKAVGLAAPDYSGPMPFMEIPDDFDEQN